MKQKVKFLLGTREIGDNKVALIKTSRNAEPHYHLFVEIVYFYKGSGIHVVNNKEIPIKHGDIFLINPFTTHSYKTASENDSHVEVYNVIFYADFLSQNIKPEKFIDDFYKKLFNAPYSSAGDKTKHIHINGDLKNSFLSLFQMIDEEYSKRDSGYLICIKSLIMTLITKIYRMSKQNAQTVNLSPNYIKQFEEICEYLKRHIADNVKLKDFASKYHFSVAYFNRLFKNYTGLTFNQFIQQERITRATELLQNTQLTIEEIIGQVGYTDKKFFYQLFQDNIGISPIKYRRYIRKDNTK